MQPVDVFRGDGPVVLGVPHAGTPTRTAASLMQGRHPVSMSCE